MNKGLLKYDGGYVMPITRGELVLDSSGNQALRSGDFLATTDANGLMPKIETTAEAVIKTLAKEWVLTSEDGKTPTWRKLPINAFRNDNTNTTYSLLGALSNNTYIITLTDSDDNKTSATISKMTGATALKDGEAGLVPYPTKDNTNHFLRGDGTWSNAYTHPNSGVTDGSYGPSANVVVDAKTNSFSVPYLSVDSAGHVTTASTKTITIKKAINGESGGFLCISGIDGVVEAGKHLDFHEANGAGTEDYLARISARSSAETNGAGLTLSGTTVGTFKGNVTGNVSGSSGSCTGNADSATCLKEPESRLNTFPSDVADKGVYFKRVYGANIGDSNNINGNMLQIGSSEGCNRLLLGWATCTLDNEGDGHIYHQYRWYGEQTTAGYASIWSKWYKVLDERDVNTGVVETAYTTNLSLSRGATRITLSVSSNVYISEFLGALPNFLNLWMLQFTTSDSISSTCSLETSNDVKWANNEPPLLEGGCVYEIIFTKMGNGNTAPITASWAQYK